MTIKGRIHREFVRNTPTLFPVAKIKSLAASQKSGARKKQRIAPGLDIEFHETEDGTDIMPAPTVAGWLDLLEILANTWSIAGAF